VKELVRESEGVSERERKKDRLIGLGMNEMVRVGDKGVEIE
jgi:hypothetical protein